MDRQARWAQNERVRIIRALGGKCQMCGKTPKDPASLQIDHINGRNYELNRLSQSGRICRYRREAKAGLLQVLCARCNKVKG